VHNGAGTLPQCVEALLDAATPDVEVIVVDDRSTDTGPAIARRMGATVVTNTRGTGPAAARNAGAAMAHGDILFFVDADVIVGPTTIRDVRAVLDTQPQVAAVFGSYDAEPAAPNFVSQYKNLYHHFVHQQAQVESSSFWAGCGAIRAAVFHAVGGFDEQQFPRASTEDIELGLRLRKSGHAVRLEKHLQVTHLKRWDLVNLVHTDIVHRAIPWSRLLVANGSVPDDLNLQLSQRVSAAMVGLLLLMLPFLAMGHRRFYGVEVAPLAVATCVFLLANILFLNRRFYEFLARHRGCVFALMAIPVHLLYYLYSGLTFVSFWGYSKVSKPR
jgi:glycosyltransferase involved in cell wall biosynthesis